MSNQKIFVTQPFLPPLEEFLPYVKEIWESKYLTNGGPKHQLLETTLAEYLGVEHMALFNNGTNALMTALQALELTGEVITTPFSFIATSNALLWNGIKPVFSDIDPITLNLDPSRIEAAITPQTTAILPVHCYGNPCDIAAINDIARRHNLKVVYDAAHAFAVHDKNGSVLGKGDLSILSFHATKVFNTFEGGAIICQNAEMKKKIDNLKNFGIEDEVTVSIAGANGKMSEIHAAMGLAQLNHINEAIAQRGQVDARYRAGLRNITGLTVLPKLNQTVSNYAYFPILVGDNYPLSRDGIYNCLAEHGIRTRRYFYPLISEFPMYSPLESAAAENLPVATQMAQRIICLPIYPDLPLDDVDRILSVLTLAK